MLEYGVYLLYRAVIALAGRAPMPWLFRLGNLAGWCAWLLLTRYRNLAVRNVAIALGDELDAPSRRSLVRKHFQRLGGNLFCSMKLATMKPEEVASLVQLENPDGIHRHLRNGRPLVLAFGHVGNWELYAQILPLFYNYTRISTVYQRPHNRFINEHLQRTRSQGGVELFDRSEGFGKPIALLRAGGGVGVLCDQHAGDHGIWTPFFGRIASTTTLPALLARRTGAAVVPAAVYTCGPGRWRMLIGEDLSGAADSVADLTARVSRALEEQIRTAPEDWFWVHDRWKTPKPEFLLSRYKRGVYLPAETENLKPFRILLRAPNWLGDAIMSVPAVRAIKGGRPDVHLSVASPENLAAIWDDVPEVDAVLPLRRGSLFATASLLRRRGPFDVAILFPNSTRSALEVWLAGIPRRVGYRGHARSLLLNQIIRERKTPGPPLHHAERYLRLAEQIGAPAAAPSFPIQQRGGHNSTLGLCPGAEYGPAKRWLPERFAEAAEQIARDTGAHWLIFGVARDAAAGNPIASRLGASATNLIGKTSLAELINRLRECGLLLTNDTGTMHLAAFLGVPTVAVFGSTEPRLTAPLGDGHIVLRHHVECSPCFLRECPIDFRCMNSVSTAEVVAAVRQLLQQPPRI